MLHVFYVVYSMCMCSDTIDHCVTLCFYGNNSCITFGSHFTVHVLNVQCAKCFLYKIAVADLYTYHQGSEFDAHEFLLYLLTKIHTDSQ